MLLDCCFLSLFVPIEFAFESGQSLGCVVSCVLSHFPPLRPLIEPPRAHEREEGGALLRAMRCRRLVRVLSRIHRLKMTPDPGATSLSRVGGVSRLRVPMNLGRTPTRLRTHQHLHQRSPPAHSLAHSLARPPPYKPPPHPLTPPLIHQPTNKPNYQLARAAAAPSVSRARRGSAPVPPPPEGRWRWRPVVIVVGVCGLVFVGFVVGGSARQIRRHLIESRRRRWEGRNRKPPKQRNNHALTRWGSAWA